MNDTLKLAEQAARSEDYESAERLCVAHLGQSPTDKEAKRLLAEVFALSRRHEKALTTISEVLLATSDKPEPHDHFSRGRWALEMRSYENAAADFETVISLCDRYGDDYYSEAAYFHHAIVCAQIGMTDAARKSLSHVGDECTAFALGAVYSKKSLMKALMKTLP